MADVVAEAKSMESTQETNKLIIDKPKGIDKAVNRTGSERSTSFQIKHPDMKLRHEPNTCDWCEGMRGPHKWEDCPANGRTCLKCGGYDHFAGVCLEQSPFNNKPNQPRNNKNPLQRSKPNNQPVHSIQGVNQSEMNPTYMSPQPINDQTSILMSSHYITAPHTQWNKAKRIINQVINIMLI